MYYIFDATRTGVGLVLNIVAVAPNTYTGNVIINLTTVKVIILPQELD